jgi:hypothetical protein
MRIDDGFAALKFFENRLKDRVSEVHAVRIRKKNKAISMPASSMNEMLASLDHRSGASPPTGACAFSVACQKKSGKMW